MRTARSAGGQVAVRIHVTEPADANDEERSLDGSPSVEKHEDSGSADEKHGTAPSEISHRNGRPDLVSLISEKGKSWSGHVGVAGLCLVQYFV